jgi:hypothetical protein
MLVGVAFSLWRAAFLADALTRTWPEALDDDRSFSRPFLGRMRLRLALSTLAKAGRVAII